MFTLENLGCEFTSLYILSTKFLSSFYFFFSSNSAYFIAFDKILNKSSSKEKGFISKSGQVKAKALEATGHKAAQLEEDNEQGMLVLSQQAVSYTTQNSLLREWCHP